MTIYSKQSPLITWNTDENGVRQAIEVTNEEIRIINNIAILNYKPSEYHRVTLGDIIVGGETIEFIEIGIKEKIDTINKFKVDYNNGIVFFHPTLDGFTLNVSQYFSEGLILYHVSRIYYRNANDVVVTLEEYLNTLNNLINDLNVAGLEVLDLYDTLESLELAHPTGNAGDAYAVGTELANVVYVWSESLNQWLSIGSLKGSKGDKGDKGDIGVSPTITIGTVTTGAAGTSASAEITGTTPNLVLNLTIPKGDTGESGASSAASVTYDNTASGLTATDAQGAIDELNTEKVNKTNVVNNLNETVTGKVLDATQGKILDGKITGINTLLSSGIVSTPTVNLGMNSVIRREEGMTSFPKITMQGKSYVNLLGKDGNCEDVSKWSTSFATLALDTSNKVLGNNGIKITIDSGNSALMRKSNALPLNAPLPDLTGKYVFFSAYVKNGNASTGVRIIKEQTGGGTGVTSPYITNTSIFTRVGIKIDPLNYNPSNYFCTQVVGEAGQYGYADGIMLNEITADEYNNLTVDQLLEKYPYVDSYACLENPYIEVRHDNLVRNGNCEEGIAWWTPDSSNITVTVVNGKFRVTGASSAGSATQKIPVKRNTDYYIARNITTGTSAGILIVKNSAGTTLKSASAGTFNSGDTDYLVIHMYVSATGYCDFDSIMLIEGTTAPASYKPCRIERCVVEGKFTSDDSFVLENGEVTGLLNWKHRTLFGKDYDWRYAIDATGFKKIAISPVFSPVLLGHYCVKYDGKIVKEDNSLSVSDTFINSPAYGFYISIADTDSGWAETVDPNDDEVKAFMNGWRAIWNDNYRYTAFKSVVDGSLPACTIRAPISATTNTTSITVSSGGTQFVSGDTILVLTPTMTVRSSGVVTGTPTATNIPTTASVNVVSGDIVIKKDNGGAGITTILTWCKNNIALGYEGYQLHYKLANPEPITDANVHIHGDIPKLDNGDNYLCLDYGMVLGEVANPYSNGTHITINDNSTTFMTSILKNKTESISSIYRNQIFDLSKWTLDSLQSYGNQRAYMTVASGNFDFNAAYTVDYQILKTMHTSPTSIAMQYQQDVLSAIADLSEAVNSRQKADSALDTIVDLSVYEEFDISTSPFSSFVHVSNTLYVRVSFQMMPKKIKPVITVKSRLFKVGGGSSGYTDSTDKFVFAGVDVSKNVASLLFSTTDSSTITAIKANGISCSISAVADCRGRV